LSGMHASQNGKARAIASPTFRFLNLRSSLGHQGTA